VLQALVALDQHVELVVQPARKAHVPGITVAANPPEMTTTLSNH
jgi:hypothetical protein